MVEKIVRDINFKYIMEAHARGVIEYLLEKNQTFSVLCNYEFVDFNPILPDDIRQTFQPLIMFSLAGYTLESASVDYEYLYFEAGFGQDNIGSFVTIPLFAILHIVVEDSVLFVNLTAGNDEFKKTKEEQDGIKNSMDALLSNPENQKFMRAKK